MDGHTVDMDLLEKYVDENSLSVVVALLAEICHVKEDHVRANWQDVPLAQDWARCAKILKKAALRIL